ncbi:Interferon-induced helicase C domain-containing protein 1 [Lobulomyces angularis]|nr:Interferon-induced helicase C domain-containing protein 1 [Lobulomyces angularis]
MTLKLRPYQSRLALTAQEKSCIIVLPTGCGKTLIACDVIKNVGKKTLFLVPSVMLVNQQSLVIRRETKLNVTTFSGGQRSVSNIFFDVLVTTPDALLNSQKRIPLLDIASFDLVVFDEVHHLIKKHPYRIIAQRIKEIGSNPKILGLTASLTYHTQTHKIPKMFSDICDDLSINISEILTASNEELEKDNFFQKQTVKYDSNEYIIKKGIFWDVLQTNTSTYFLNKISENSPILHPITVAIYNSVKYLEDSYLKNKIANFTSPIQAENKLSYWLKYASELKTRHKTSKDADLKKKILFYCALLESLKFIVTTFQKNLELSLYFLFSEISNDNFEVEPFNLIKQEYELLKDDFEELSSLKSTLLNAYLTNENFFGILFAEQRISCHVINDFIAKDAELKDKLKSTFIYSTSAITGAALSPHLNISSTQFNERVNAFKSKKFNLLITTSVAEEGIDIKDTNVVIRFDTVQNPVSFKQSKGRARHVNSEFFVLKEEDKLKALIEAERYHDNFIQNLSNSLEQFEEDKTKSFFEENVEDEILIIDENFDFNFTKKEMEEFKYHTKNFFIQEISKVQRNDLQTLNVFIQNFIGYNLKELKCSFIDGNWFFFFAGVFNLAYFIIKNFWHQVKDVF